MKVKIICLLDGRENVVGIELNQQQFRSYTEEDSREIIFFPEDAQQVDYCNSYAVEAIVEFCVEPKLIIVPHALKGYHTEVLSNYVRLRGAFKAIQKRAEKFKETSILEKLKQLRKKFEEVMA